MNILFDLITTQKFIGGAAEYVRKIYYTLQEVTDSDTKIIGIIDSRIGKYAYEDLSPNILQLKYVDINNNSLKDIVKRNNIDVIFIGCLQYWTNYSFEGIDTRIVGIVHDLCDEEYNREKLVLYANLNNPKKFLKIISRTAISKIYHLVERKIDNLIRLENLELVTVSEYSKATIEYNFPTINKKIKVLYSPERIIQEKNDYDNIDLKHIIEQGKRYYLILGGNREMKNTKKAINAFKKYIDTFPIKDRPYVVTIGEANQYYSNQIVLPYLSESDLVRAYKNCYSFIFPSYFEGFGYPPLEAMKYGKPILASNTTSIQEICGDAPIYFSPIYESDIYRALFKLDEVNYHIYSHKSKLRYKEVQIRQNNDLKELIKFIQHSR